MKEKINTYFATLIVTIAGAGATLLIVHVASADAANFVFDNSQYNQLEVSMLKK